MSNSEAMLAELCAADEWTRSEKLDGIAGFYGDGFARLMRRQVEAELARRAAKARKGQS